MPREDVPHRFPNAVFVFSILRSIRNLNLRVYKLEYYLLEKNLNFQCPIFAIEYINKKFKRWLLLLLFVTDLLLNKPTTCYAILIDTLFVYRYVFITNYIRLQTRIVGKNNTKHYIMSYVNNIYHAIFSLFWSRYLIIVTMKYYTENKIIRKNYCVHSGP